jgi:YjbE family integral membrane protein
LTVDHRFLIALLEIIWINILLSGDNAVAIALACRPLPPHLRRWGVMLGSLAAVILRIVFAVFVVYLLEVPYLKIVGSLLLLWIAVKLILPEEHGEPGGVSGGSTIFAAVRTIVIADAVMSLDNVIAIAAAANGSLVLLIAGLAISVPLIVYGSTLVLKALERFAILITAGGALLGYIAGDIAIGDPVLVDWVKEQAPYLDTIVRFGEFRLTGAGIGGASFVVIVAMTLIRLMETRRRRKVDIVS